MNCALRRQQGSRSRLGHPTPCSEGVPASPRSAAPPSRCDHCSRSLPPTPPSTGPPRPPAHTFRSLVTPWAQRPSFASATVRGCRRRARPPRAPQACSTCRARWRKSVSPRCSERRLHYQTSLRGGGRGRARTSPDAWFLAPVRRARNRDSSGRTTSLAPTPPLARPARGRLGFREVRAATPLSGRSFADAVPRKRKCDAQAVRVAVGLGGPEV